MLIAQLFEAARWLQAIASGELKLLPEAWQALSESFCRFFRDVLGLEPEAGESKGEILQSVMEMVLELRKEVRQKKDWAMSDLIRDRLAQAGIEIQDGKSESTWTLKS